VASSTDILIACACTQDGKPGATSRTNNALRTRTPPSLNTIGTFLQFEGVIGCDYVSAYREFMRLDGNVKLQFCIAHLIRDIKLLCTHPDPQNRHYGHVLREHFRKLFLFFPFLS